MDKGVGVDVKRKGALFPFTLGVYTLLVMYEGSLSLKTIFVASHHLRQEFPDLKKLPALWTPTYFLATTGGVSTDTVKKYIESQRGK